MTAAAARASVGFPASVRARARSFSSPATESARSGFRAITSVAMASASAYRWARISTSIAPARFGEDSRAWCSISSSARAARASSPLFRSASHRAFGQARGQPLDEPPPLVELPHRQKPGGGRDLPGVLLDHRRRIREKVEHDLVNTLRRHAILSCLVQRFV